MCTNTALAQLVFSLQHNIFISKLKIKYNYVIKH